MGCGETCIRALRYQQLDPERGSIIADNNSLTQVIIDLGVPQVVTALQDDDELNLSDAELETSLNATGTKYGRRKNMETNDEPRTAHKKTRCFVI
jgi:hypothetical protein